MDSASTEFPGGRAVVTAYQDAAARLLMVELEADPRDRPAPLRIGIALDRSGSMSGEPFRAAVAATERFLATLGPEDRVHVVAFESMVSSVIPYGAVPADASDRLNALYATGSTAFYAGWKGAAEPIPDGGRVIVLSDGEANVGPVTAFGPLSAEARSLVDGKAIATTTIGLGPAYDEVLLGEMAAESAGSHYYAPSPADLDRVFSLERTAIEEASFAAIFLRAGGRTRRLGSLGHVERMVQVVPVRGLDGAMTIRTVSPDGSAAIHALALPSAFGDDPRVTLAGLRERAANRLRVAGRIATAEDAARAAHGLRQVADALAIHPLADEGVSLLVDRLEVAAQNLEALVTHFDTERAAQQRKRSYRAMHNVAAPRKAHSTDAEDDHLLRVEELRATKAPFVADRAVVDGVLFPLKPIEFWVTNECVPVVHPTGRPAIAMRDPRDRFRRDAVAAALGLSPLLALGPVSREWLAARLGESPA